VTAEAVLLSVKPGRLLRRLKHGDLANVRYSDLSRMLQALGFRQIRRSGSHHIFRHPRVAELVNLQDVGGQAKPYQIRQVLRLLARYNLNLEDEP
jgi:predicted RNA binding protein YcfA (HicA-like mRNA interferase family)